MKVRAAACFLLCGLGALVLARAAVADETPQDRIAAARGVVADFAAQLKEALVGAMEEGGPAAAVEACRTIAPALAADAFVKSGWEVGRTSLKTRNSANAPDAWEAEVLRSFVAGRAAGEDPAGLEAWTIAEADGQRRFRYMKAIPTAPLCLTCHGRNVDPALRERIKALYPDDAATGYGEGDIRGAFTISQPM